MALSPEARQIVDVAGARFSGLMSATPVHELREMLRASAILPVTPIFERHDQVVASAAGGVPVRIYRPSPRSDLPVLMWLHSGGFVVGDLNQNDEYLRQLSIAAQVVVVSVDYRLAPENRHPAALEDAHAVWTWIASGRAQLSEDPSNAVLAGESAGGAIAFALSQKLKDAGGPMPVSQISFYGSAETRVSNPELTTSLLTPDDCEWFWDQYVPDLADRDDPAMSPARATDLTLLPPTFIATAEVDPTRDATEEYGRRLADAGVWVEQARYEGVMHGFATMIAALAPAAELFDRTIDFIGRTVRINRPNDSGSE